MNKLSELRKSKNLSQQEVADFLNVTRQAYSNYELGKREADYPALEKLAIYFNVSIGYILGNEQKNKPTVQNDGLADNDIEFLKKIKKLNGTSRELAEIQIDALLAHQDKINK